MCSKTFHQGGPEIFFSHQPNERALLEKQLGLRVSVPVFLRKHIETSEIYIEIYVISVLFLFHFRALLFIDALWSPAGKGLTSWLLFVMSNCDVVTFPLVSWVRCGA